MEDTKLSRILTVGSARLATQTSHRLAAISGECMARLHQVLKELEKTDESIDRRGINPD